MPGCYPAPAVPVAASNSIAWGWSAVPLAGLAALLMIQRKRPKLGRAAGF